MVNVTKQTSSPSNILNLSDIGIEVLVFIYLLTFSFNISCKFCAFTRRGKCASQWVASIKRSLTILITTCIKKRANYISARTFLYVFVPAYISSLRGFNFFFLILIIWYTKRTTFASNATKLTAKNALGS